MFELPTLTLAFIAGAGDAARLARIGNASIAPGLVDALSILGVGLLLSALGVVGARKLHGYVTAFVGESLMVTLIAVLVGAATGKVDLYLVAALTLIIKVGTIPTILRAIIQRLPIQQERNPLLSTPTSLLIALALTMVAFFTAPAAIAPGTFLNEPPLAISLALVLIGLFVMSTRRHALAQVVGLLTIENGLFSGAIAIAYGLPLIVEFGILFDILVAVVVMTLLVRLMQRTMTTADTLDLRRLQG